MTVSLTRLVTAAAARGRVAAAGIVAAAATTMSAAEAAAAALLAATLTVATATATVATARVVAAAARGSRTRARSRTPERHSSGPHSSERHSRKTDCTGCGRNGCDGTVGDRTADGRSHCRNRTSGPHRSRRRSRNRSHRRTRHLTCQTTGTHSPGTRDTTGSQQPRRTQGSSWKIPLGQNTGRRKRNNCVSPEPPAPRQLLAFGGSRNRDLQRRSAHFVLKLGVLSSPPFAPLHFPARSAAISPDCRAGCTRRAGSAGCADGRECRCGQNSQ